MKLGWYIHHHGRGHLHRFLAVAPHLGPVTVLTSLSRPAELPDVTWVQLPMDVPVSQTAADSATAGGVLHWAPLGAGGYRDRMTTIAAWIAAEQPDAIVVDVSVEVALASRLAGVPVIWVAQRGRREDLPHRLAFSAASRIIAPWTEAVQDDGVDTASSWPQTVHVGALSRFDHLGSGSGSGSGSGFGSTLGSPSAFGSAPSAPGGESPSTVPAQRRRVLVLLGFGGHAITAADIRAASGATPDWTWHVTGVDDMPSAANVTVEPPDANVWAQLTHASVVVASASGNAIAEVAAARRSLILLPQDRPFAEQRHQAAALAGAGLAEVCESWPEAARWPALLSRAARRDPATWELLHDGGGGARFARQVREVACG